MSGNDTRLVYIMGRGHSGSTVLDAMLGNAEEIESVGELVSGIDRFEALCSCKVLFRDCEFWNRVREVFEQRANLTWDSGIIPIKRQAHIKHFVKTLLMRKSSAATQELIRLNRELIEAISDASGKSCIVDSSKEVTRALMLLRALSDTRTIHLLRNPEGIIASDLHRINQGTGFKFLRRVYYGRHLSPLFVALSSTNWVVGNLLAEFIHLLFSHQVLRVRYEDLCQQPRQELERIAYFIDCDLESVICAIESSQSMLIGHNIGGNHMRMAGEFVFDPRAGSKRPLPWPYKLLTRFIAWPLMLVYGYRPW